MTDADCMYYSLQMQTTKLDQARYKRGSIGSGRSRLYRGWNTGPWGTGIDISKSCQLPTGSELPVVLL